MPHRCPSPPIDAEASARWAGLRYVTSIKPGITRFRAGRGWRFLLPNGERLADAADIARIRSLAIPPAWKQVWICADPSGHLQAIGIDFKGRKQYRYHARYREVRDASKFTRMADFGKALPKIRARVEKDLRRKGMPREKVMAALVRLLEETSIRVGNREYARDNSSFGLTTLRDRHVRVGRSSLSFRFKGKSGIEHEVELCDRRLARIVKSCQDLPGQELFQYINETGERVAVSSEDLNAYIRDISGADFTAKDFRTWNGTRAALIAFSKAGAAANQTAAAKTVVEVVKTVARVLGNRPATCRKYYIHPAVVDAYLEAGKLSDCEAVGLSAKQCSALDSEEAALLRILSSYAPQTTSIKRARVGLMA